MPPRAKRATLGIRRDRYGWRCYVKVADEQREKRYPRGTALRTMEQWVQDTRAALRLKARRFPKDTLRADALRYLVHMKATLAPSSYASRVCEIEAWYPAFADTPRHLITRDAILEERQRWLTAEHKAPKTCNHRVRALAHLYRYLDGSKAPTPCDDVPKLKEPDADPQFVSVRVIKRVAETLTDPKTRARFMVLSSTGQRPAQLKRAQPGDLDLRRRVWLVRAAKGGQPIPVWLTDDMVAAWRAFLAARAWGPFDGSDYVKQLYAAGWPTQWTTVGGRRRNRIRPYNAKHTVAIQLAEADAQWEDIRDWFGHKDLKTTRIYTGLVRARLKRTGALLDGRIGWTPSGLPAAARPKQRKSSKTGGKRAYVKRADVTG